jgi:hypothetical protein
MARLARFVHIAHTRLCDVERGRQFDYFGHSVYYTEIPPFEGLHGGCKSSSTVQRLVCSMSVPGTGIGKLAEISKLSRLLANPNSGEMYLLSVETPKAFNF